jgi:hypothetical protein
MRNWNHDVQHFDFDKNYTLKFQQNHSFSVILSNSPSNQTDTYIIIRFKLIWERYIYCIWCWKI